MHDLPFEKVSNGSESDMRVRPHIQPVPNAKGGRPHLVKEDEGADHAAMSGRKRPADGETITKVPHGRQDDLVHAINGTAA
jgi:hypothetical protein